MKIFLRVTPVLIKLKYFRMKRILLCLMMFFAFQAYAQQMTEIPDVLTVIHSRKSVRQYTDQKVERNKLETLVRAGMAAPTAVNRQPWAFIVIDSREILDRLADELGGNRILKAAPSAIVVCGDLNKALQSVPDYWVQDCSAATQNILLAAEGIGLGAVWMGVFPREERISAVSKVCNLPEYLIPLNVIAIGYPTGVEQPKDKWKPENLYWNSFE
jgi:nitroreductase